MKLPQRSASLFELNGIPKFTEAFPLALQHVVAMIVGCVTPALIISTVAHLPNQERVLLIQASLIVSALSTFLQLYPIGNKEGLHLGSGLPVILGISFAYVPSMVAIAAGFGVPAILGARLWAVFVLFWSVFLLKGFVDFFHP